MSYTTSASVANGVTEAICVAMILYKLIRSVQTFGLCMTPLVNTFYR
jgi:hypothetical protein